MSETLIVASIVILAAGHVAYRYLPRAWFKLRAKNIADKGSAGCGSGCTTCGGCAPDTPARTKQ